MAGTLITVTDAGRAALVAPGHDGTNAHKVVEIGLVTAPFTVDKGLTALPNERKRIATIAGENIAADTIHLTLKDDTDDQYTLFGFGMYVEDGTLVAIYCQPTAIMEKSPQAMLLLSTDIQFVSIDAAQLVFGDASFTNPPATTEKLGVIELATQSEVDAGTDSVRAVTPKTAAQRYAAITGADFSGPISAKGTGNGTKRATITSDATAASLLSDGDAKVGSANAGGSLQLVAGNAVAMRLQSNGRALIGTNVDDGIGLLQVAGLITAQTPPAGDVSKRVATTEFVIGALSGALVGSIGFEARATARAGFLKLNGALLNRADYPALWAYAQASGNLVTEADWNANNWGAFSTGDGVSTFRIPEFRGEFIRCFDDGRGVDASRKIGSYQADLIGTHSHAATAAAIGDHAHTAYSDNQGNHAHSIADGGHAHAVAIGRVGVVAVSYGQGNGPYNMGSADVYGTSGSGTGIGIYANGLHAHNISMNAAGGHTHAITVASAGGIESRPRNVAVLAMIRAY